MEVAREEQAAAGGGSEREGHISQISAVMPRWKAPEKLEGAAILHRTGEQASSGQMGSQAGQGRAGRSGVGPTSGSLVDGIGHGVGIAASEGGRVNSLASALADGRGNSLRPAEGDQAERVGSKGQVGQAAQGGTSGSRPARRCTTL